MMNLHYSKNIYHYYLFNQYMFMVLHFIHNLIRQYYIYHWQSRHILYFMIYNLIKCFLITLHNFLRKFNMNYLSMNNYMLMHKQITNKFHYKLIMYMLHLPMHINIMINNFLMILIKHNHINLAFIIIINI